MFGKKKKEKFLTEVAEILSELGNISRQEAEEFVSEYSHWILRSRKRGLDPQGAVWHISHQTMDLILTAHQFHQFHETEVVPDFMLLVSLRIAQIVEGAEEGSNLMSPFWASLELPIDPDKPDRKYGDLIRELVAKETESGKLEGNQMANH